jgi:hypothetical protein
LTGQSKLPETPFSETTKSQTAKAYDSFGGNQSAFTNENGGI